MREFASWPRRRSATFRIASRSRVSSFCHDRSEASGFITWNPPTMNAPHGLLGFSSLIQSRTMNTNSSPPQFAVRRCIIPGSPLRAHKSNMPRTSSAPPTDAPSRSGFACAPIISSPASSISASRSWAYSRAAISASTLLPDASGKAICPKASRSCSTKLSTNLAFIGSKRTFNPETLASAALVSRLGFRKEGFSPKYLFINGDWRDHDRWAILSDEWPAHRDQLFAS